MKRWRVETQVTSTCTYYVEAADEKDAKAASVDATAEYSEDINEETMSIIEVDKDGKPVVPLTSSERLLLEWLIKDDGQYGECHGATLDSLIAKGYATVGCTETGLDNGFIAKGADIMYRAVSITDAGRRVSAPHLHQRGGE